MHRPHVCRLTAAAAAATAAAITAAAAIIAAAVAGARGGCGERGHCERGPEEHRQQRRDPRAQAVPCEDEGVAGVQAQRRLVRGRVRVRVRVRVKVRVRGRVRVRVRVRVGVRVRVSRASELSSRKSSCSWRFFSMILMATLVRG